MNVFKIRAVKLYNEHPGKKSITFISTMNVKYYVFFPVMPCTMSRAICIPCSPGIFFCLRTRKVTI